MQFTTMERCDASHALPSRALELNRVVIGSVDSSPHHVEVSLTTIRPDQHKRAPVMRATEEKVEVKETRKEEGPREEKTVERDLRDLPTSLYDEFRRFVLDQGCPSMKRIRDRYSDKEQVNGQSVSQPCSRSDSIPHASSSLSLFTLVIRPFHSVV
jgi:hypothetical protein